MDHVLLPSAGSRLLRALLCSTILCDLLPAAPARGFVSREPARDWEHSLVAGNGKLGAMLYGLPGDETVVVNHGRLYLPLHQPLPPPATAPLLPEIRRLMAEGQYQTAADLVVKTANDAGYGGKRWTDPFVPACDLRIESTARPEPDSYRRTVDFETGLATAEWQCGTQQGRRRVFVSRADDLIAVSIDAGEGKTLDCRLRLATRPAKGQGGWNAEKMFKDGVSETTAQASDGFLTYRCGFRRRWPGSLQGQETAARVIVDGGSARADRDTIAVTGAKAALVLIRVELLDDFTRSRLPAMKSALGKVDASFDSLLARHAALHGSMFRRVRLDLGGREDHRLPVEELLADSKVGKLSPALLEKVFDSARHLVISSSGDVFPNLQGLWTGTWSPPWSGDFTLNGNVQCAIAGDLPGNLAECLEPYFRFHEQHMDEFRENARRLYGCRGIHVPSRASSHGLNNHFDGTWPMTFWTAGAAWAARFFHDYAIFTADRDFLANRAIPFMKEAALFYEDFLVTGPDGILLFSPSYSPENNPANNPSQACVNATMDIAAARELLVNLVADCESLGIEAQGVARWKKMLEKLPAYQINADGAIKEWTTPLLHDNYAHRHVSHLYGLYASLPDDVAADNGLRQAFRVALEKRMEIRRKENGGIMAFGLVQTGLAATSLHDAGMAYEVVDWLTNHFWRNNLVSTHNPDEIFNTDICGGLPALVLRMLVDSRPGRVELLPALPPKWPQGVLSGARCAGNIELRQLRWSPTLVTATFLAGNATTIDLTIHGDPKSRKLDLPAGREVNVTLQRMPPN